MLGCLLLGAVVLGCDPRASDYLQAAQLVPANHWQLVRRIRISDAPRGRASRGGTITLPAEATPGVLYHELGHLVGFQHGGLLLDAWYLDFWRGARPHGNLPSGYARRNSSEDFAESYRRLLEGTLGDCCPGRAAWLRSRLSGPD